MTLVADRQILEFERTTPYRESEDDARAPRMVRRTRSER